MTKFHTSELTTKCAAIENYCVQSVAVCDLLYDEKSVHYIILIMTDQLCLCVFLLQIQNDIIEILVSFAVVDTGTIPTKEDGTQ